MIKRIRNCIMVFPLVILLTSFKMHADELFDELFVADYGYSGAATRAPSSPFDIVNLLNQLGFVDLLRENFFNKTFDLNKRDLLDYPLFMFPWRHPHCRVAGYQFFYNGTDQMRFASNCSKISAYLNIGGQGFAEKLQAIFQAIKNINRSFDPEQAVEILALAENFIVQERRLGIMFNNEHKVGQWRVRWFFPFYLRERNHFTNPGVQAALEEILGTSSQDEQDVFNSQHLISDQLGFGDGRIEFDRPVCCFPTMDARLGFFITIPMALAVGKGLIGTDLQPPQVRPLLNLQKLLDAEDVFSRENQLEVTNYLLAALDNLSAMLLNTRLGNNGHFGLGCAFRSKSCLGTFIPRPWAQNIKMRSRMSAELILPATERRFFINDDSQSAFAGRDFSNSEQANSNYNFLVQTLTDRLFPFTGYAQVFPGVIFRSTSRALYEGEFWNFFLGTDTYIRTAESIDEVSCPKYCRLAVDKAEHSGVYQSKLIAGLSFAHCGSHHDWTFSLNGDTTVLSTGLGDDFMITLNIDVNF